MPVASEGRRLLALLADLLDYPVPDLAHKAREFERLIRGLAPQAAERMIAFRGFLEGTAPDRLEEVYSGFFDLNPLCHPYVGYHLFGETYKRSLFLLGLKQRYQQLGFAMDAAELPDRISVVLRFIATCADDALRHELIGEALLPALERMGAAGKANHPPEEAHSCAPELEGHSHGDVLEGGYLLKLIEGEHANGNSHPYWDALHVLRQVLSSSPDERPRKVTA